MHDMIGVVSVFETLRKQSKINWSPWNVEMSNRLMRNSDKALHYFIYHRKMDSLSSEATGVNRAQSWILKGQTVEIFFRFAVKLVCRNRAQRLEYIHWVTQSWSRINLKIKLCVIEAHFPSKYYLTCLYADISSIVQNFAIHFFASNGEMRFFKTESYPRPLFVFLTHWVVKYWRH